VTRAPSSSSREWIAPLGLSSLTATVLGAALFYPRLATWLYETASGGRGWDGSGLIYFQLTIVLPCAAGLLATSLSAYLMARGTGRLRKDVVVAVAWVVSLLGFATSVCWYASRAG